MSAQEIIEDMIGEFRRAIDDLREAAGNDAALRLALLENPAAELGKRSIPVPPGVTVRFFETAPGEFAVPLPPRESGDAAPAPTPQMLEQTRAFAEEAARRDAARAGR